jgi:(p)ppGpp synthase/HD superfamily hydrolase
MSNSGNYRSIANAEERAVRIAVDAHCGQIDKQGIPFIYHLLRVMLAVEGSEEKQVAVLHDLLEDTAWTQADLIQAGFSRSVIDAIVLLTRDETEPYSDYVVRLADNALAVTAKLADLNDNYRLSRVAFREQHALEDMHRIARYVLSYDFLCGRMTQANYLLRMQDVQ